MNKNYFLFLCIFQLKPMCNIETKDCSLFVLEIDIFVDTRYI